MTFDMLCEVPSNHLIQQFGHALHNHRLEHIARVSANSGLTKKTREDGITHTEPDRKQLPGNKRAAWWDHPSSA